MPHLPCLPLRPHPTGDPGLLPKWSPLFLQSLYAAQTGLHARVTEVAATGDTREYLASLSARWCAARETRGQGVGEGGCDDWALPCGRHCGHPRTMPSPSSSGGKRGQHHPEPVVCSVWALRSPCQSDGRDGLCLQGPSRGWSRCDFRLTDPHHDGEPSLGAPGLMMGRLDQPSTPCALLCPQGPPLHQ